MNKRMLQALALMLAMLLALLAACAFAEEEATGAEAAEEAVAEEAVIEEEAAEDEEAEENGTVVEVSDGDPEAEEEADLRRLRLGSSVYTLMIDEDFVAGELTEADIAAGQIGCWQHDETGLDLDVFQFPKDGAEAGDLGRLALLQAADDESVEVVWPTDVQNDIDIAWYWGTRTRDGEGRQVAVFFLDSGDTYVKLVFWMADDEAGAEAWDIIGTLDYMQLKEIRLGTSDFTLTVPDDFQQGEISDEDIADDQVAYWYSNASLLDFDVYQFSKEGVSQTLAEYAVEESSTYPAVSELVTDGEINQIPVAWYRAVDECAEGEYDTITYIIDAGDEFIEVVFWLDGPTAEAEASYIIHNLINNALAE